MELFQLRRVSSEFTIKPMAFMNGIIVGFFDKGVAEFVKEDLEEILKELGTIDITDKDDNKIEVTFVTYKDFEIIQYASYRLLVYYPNKIIKCNGEITKRGLLSSLEGYLYIIEKCTDDYIRYKSRIARCFGYNSDEDMMYYLERSVQIFGLDIFNRDHFFYRTMCDDIFFRAYRNAIMWINDGLDIKERIRFPNPRFVMEEKRKLIMRLTRGKVLSIINI